MDDIDSRSLTTQMSENKQSQKEVVVFIDDPMTPLDRWDTVGWNKSGHEKIPGIWRMAVMPRMRSVIPENDTHSDFVVWREDGYIMRSLLASLYNNALVAYLYSHDASDELLQALDAGSTKDIWTVVSEKKDAFCRVPISRLFEISWWPGRWWRGACIVVPSTSDISQQMVDSMIEEDIQKLLTYFRQPRNDIDKLRDILKCGGSYINVNNLSPPESPDPWIFFNGTLKHSYIPNNVTTILSEAGYDVYVSHNILEYYDWQENQIIPSDAVLIHSN
jgi:hypothetical protein